MQKNSPLPAPNVCFEEVVLLLCIFPLITVNDPNNLVIFQVLMAWYKVTRRTVQDLYILLQKAERAGMVQTGTSDDLRTGKVWKSDYLDNREFTDLPKINFSHTFILK